MAQGTSYSCPPQALHLAIEDMVIEVVILIGWVENVALHLSEPPKRNGDGDLIMGSGELLRTQIGGKHYGRSKHILLQGWPPGGTARVNYNHQKTNSAQVSSHSRAARCSLNFLWEAEVFDWRWRAAAGKIFLWWLFNLICARSGKTHIVHQLSNSWARFFAAGPGVSSKKSTT
jgi:hypothetical protein